MSRWSYLVTSGMGRVSASRYAEPLLLRIAGEPGSPCNLCIVQGPGSFGRQVADGAEAIARRLGIRAIRVSSEDQISPPGMSGEWDMFSAGVFEQDAETVGKALRLPTTPSHVFAIAAGVREFSNTVDDSESVFGIAQWFPEAKARVELGPSEEDFARAYAGAAACQPDYPAVQAAAGAIIATHCARLAGGTTRDGLWATARDLDTSTFYGGFKIDPATDAQLKHQPALVRWSDGEPVSAGMSREQFNGRTLDADGERAAANRLD